MPKSRSLKIDVQRQTVYDARELWSPSPSPVEDWGDEADVDFEMQIVGEEVAFNGAMKYEVAWKNWMRPDGTNTTWEGPETTSEELPTREWLSTVQVRTPARPDIVLWGSTDITNTLTREHIQGLRSLSADEMRVFEKDFDELESAREQLQRAMQYVPRSDEYVESRRPRAFQENAEAGPSRATDSAAVRDDEVQPKRRSRAASFTGSYSISKKSWKLAKEDTADSRHRPMIFSWRAGLPLPIPRLPSGSSQPSVPISNAGTRIRLVHVDPSRHPEARRVLQPSPTKPKNKSAEPVFPIRASPPISILPSLTHRSSRLRTIPKVSSSSSIDAIQNVSPNKRKTTLLSSPMDCASGKRVRLTDTYPTPPASNRSSASLIELKAQSRRMFLQQQWSDLARNDRGAERVSFVNTVNDEAVPDGLEGFVYLEHSYHLPPQLGSVPCLDLDSRELHPATPLTDRDRLVYCDCKPGCTNADQCTCQSNCEEAGYAYTDGLFNFTYHKNQIVVECNPYCSCPETCPNRVAQRPRHIPIEIFRTEKQGWGARTSVPIQRGRVLGLYTGKLIPRLEAETLANAAYCFDLDFNDEQVDDPTCLLSVDSCSYGNWTRFVNHSCAPNVLVQPVVWDTLPQQNCAFLALIAATDIAPYTEFAINYDPDVDPSLPRPANSLDCTCNAPECRGWVRSM